MLTARSTTLARASRICSEPATARLSSANSCGSQQHPPLRPFAFSAGVFADNVHLLSIDVD
jgi:hypothetical protein